MSTDCRTTRGIPAFAILVLLTSLPLAAEKKDERLAPVPAQITTAKKAFVSDGGEDPHFKQSALNRSYNQFYMGLKDWGRYDLVSSPSEADLVFEISSQSQLERFRDKLEIVPFLRLIVVDPKSHTVLWVITEELESGRFYIVGSHQDEKFDEAMKRMIADVKSLVEPASSK